MPAAKSLEIGAAAQRAADCYQQLAWAGTRRSEIAQLDTAGLDQHRLARLGRHIRSRGAHSFRSTTKVASSRSAIARSSKLASARCARLSSSRARSSERSTPKIAG